MWINLRKNSSELGPLGYVKTTSSKRGGKTKKKKKHDTCETDYYCTICLVGVNSSD